MRGAILQAFTITVVGLTALAARADNPCPDPPEGVGRIALDPGHGGENEGAVGVAGIYERFLTMDVAKRMRTRLAECWPDVEVVLTRQHDIDVGLSERTHVANMADADLLLSIHFNSSVNPDAEGIEVYYLASDDPETQPWPPEASLIAPSGVAVSSIVHDLRRTRLHGQSARLAAAILGPLLEHTGANDRGVKQAHFRVLRGALMPAVVCELGFLSHPDEGRRVLDNDYRERLITAMIEGIAAWAEGE